LHRLAESGSECASSALTSCKPSGQRPTKPATVKWRPNSGWTARGRETAELAAAGGGDRAANNALWVIANVRLGSDPRTKEFLAKRTATCNSRKEIMRML
jgi:hypothetical protein